MNDCYCPRRKRKNTTFEQSFQICISYFIIMEKMFKKLFCVIVLLSTVVGFSACSDDDDEVVVVPLAKQIAGEYGGTLTIGADPTEKDITLTESGENIKVSLTEFSFNGMSLGNIIVDGIALSEADSKINLAETKAALTLNLFGAEAEVDVTVSGTVKDGKLDLSILVENVPMIEGGTIPVAFAGNKK